MPIPVELPASLVIGDGKPYDVATDRHLANAINNFIDYRSAYSAPFMWDNPLSADIGTAGAELYRSVGMCPIFLGMAHYSSAVSRSLLLKPIFRCSHASPHVGFIRVTLARDIGLAAPGADGYIGSAAGTVISGPSSSAKWSTTSTSYVVGEEKSIDITPKDLNMGIAWLLIERADCGEIRGFTKLRVGPRT